MKELIHLHFVSTAYLSRPPLSAAEGEAWLRKLVDKVGMQILMDARAIYCEDLGNEGVTGVVGLTTSHASFHCWHLAERPVVRFDLYSCQEFEVQQCLDMLKEWGATEVHYSLFDREAEMKIIDQGHIVEPESA